MNLKKVRTIGGSLPRDNIEPGSKIATDSRQSYCFMDNRNNYFGENGEGL